MYHRLRRVLDTSEWYYLAGEYHSCGQCSGTFISYDWRQLRQLPDGRRGLFPAVLTHKLACDRSVVVRLRGSTLGNSPTACRNSTPPSSTTRRGQLCQYYNYVAIVCFSKLKFTFTAKHCLLRQWEIRSRATHSFRYGTPWMSIINWPSQPEGAVAGAVVDTLPFRKCAVIGLRWRNLAPALHGGAVSADRSENGPVLVFGRDADRAVSRAADRPRCCRLRGPPPVPTSLNDSAAARRRGRHGRPRDDDTLFAVTPADGRSPNC